MPPKKGTKRKSESPSTLESSGKRYQTRSSSSLNKNVKYFEDSCEEVGGKTPETQNKSDDDFIENDTPPNKSCAEIGMDEDVKRKSTKVKRPHPLPTTQSQSTSRNKKTKPDLAPSLNTNFKPVSCNSSNIKAELDLSDSDSSYSSSSEEDETKLKTSLLSNEDSAFTSPNKEACSSFTDKSEHNEPEGEEEAVYSSAWMENLKAIDVSKKTDSVSDPSSLSTHTAAPRRTKGKQLKKHDPSPGKVAGVTNDREVSSAVIELLKSQEPNLESSSEDDENWEKVESRPLAGTVSEEVPIKSVQIELEVEQSWKRKKKDKDLQDLIRLKINRVRKAIQLDLHQLSLVGLLAHGYLVNKMLQDSLILAAALSTVPASGFPPNRTDLTYLEKFVNWISKRFVLSADQVPLKCRPLPDRDTVLNCLATGKAQSYEELVYSSIALCRSLGIPSRLVLSLQPLSAKVDPNELQGKLNSKEKSGEKSSEAKKRESKKTTSLPKQRSSKEKKKGQPMTKSEKQTKKKPVKDLVEKTAEIKSANRESSRKKSSISNASQETVPTASKKSRKATVPQPLDEGKQIPGNCQVQRTRRKSAEKPVRYEESPLEDSENDRKTSRVQNSRLRPSRKPTSKTSEKREKNPKSCDEYEESSSEETDSEKPIPSSSKLLVAEKPTKIISTDESDEPIKRNTTTDVWLEVYVEQEEQWISVDVRKGRIHCERELEKNSESILYVVAFNPDLTWKDVTARYASSFLSITRKQRLHPRWTELLSLNLERPSARSKNEDECLEKSLTERPIPGSISELKGHPLYVLQRHLLKFEAIYPLTAIPVGYVRSEPVYARECVKNLHSRETWLKEAKVVRIGEKPYKIVKARPKWDRHAQRMVSDQPLDLFGEWQVEDYIPPPAVNGIVPRNAYGNVELFLPQMLPSGTKHLQIPGLNKVARKLGIDCAPAMTGWDYHGGWSHPVFDGFVVCEEHVKMLLDAWQTTNEEQELREKEKREKRVLGNWRRLIRGVLIKERIKAKYFKNLYDDEPPPADSDNKLNQVGKKEIETKKKK